mmetsp:Transcript_11559/g.26277  ORF Transcript_11559/g.26277 Transcript_11559/m.26277 type:complete len:93 (-) Transcript_11559:127-405(-)
MWCCGPRGRSWFEFQANDHDDSHGSHAGSTRGAADEASSESKASKTSMKSVKTGIKSGLLKAAGTGAAMKDGAAAVVGEKAKAIKEKLPGRK